MSDKPVEQRKEFIEALRSLQVMFGLPVTGVLDRNTLEIMRLPRRVKDSVNHRILTFSLLGRTLTHFFTPEDRRAYFDEDETWTEGTTQGTNLRLVAAYEIGHVLGLGHSKVHSALIASFYSGYNPAFRLHSDDTKRIQALYGKQESDNEPIILALPPHQCHQPAETRSLHGRSQRLHSQLKPVGLCLQRPLYLDC
ncbi:matrix metalloproteinase-19-like [Cetorhinus maximus]